VEDAPGGLADQPDQRLAGPQGQRKGEHDQRDQDEDVGPVGPPEQEEVGAAAGHVEQRLGHGEAGQRQQLAEGTQLGPEP
jgi:hypothetical protein